ncbi:hypothetical protein EVG20_g11053 [Dentipellis fragilis]|uniref:Uncharacterized protein n=1 Tax=Dentipellis fragilis TaxID=205917 RepID=A0A4Y9XMK9_9AGAM|nr:hypothetical protein EVG20_g11053 [Dentipellis fragilis]
MRRELRTEPWHCLQQRTSPPPPPPAVLVAGLVPADSVGGAAPGRPHRQDGERRARHTIEAGGLQPEMK